MIVRVAAVMPYQQDRETLLRHHGGGSQIRVRSTPSDEEAARHDVSPRTTHAKKWSRRCEGAVWSITRQVSWRWTLRCAYSSDRAPYKGSLHCMSVPSEHLLVHIAPAL
jgi:hypothetical protein